jgi:hypothetical protein
MLLGYMNTLTLRPCTRQKKRTASGQSINWEAAHITQRTECVTDHGLRREVRLELGGDNAGVAVRAGDLTPDTPVAGLTALGLGLVDVRYALPSVPRDVLLGVHPLDLHKRRGLVLVRLGPAQPPPQPPLAETNRGMARSK